MNADVLIIGAGPAGSVAALALARQGRDVVLADRADFPRDKVCGDALIPDALNALATLGIKDDVLRGAFLANELRLYAPDGTMAPVAVPIACVRRQDFDDRLRAAAVAAGARFVAPLRLAAAVERDGAVRGARFAAPDGAGVEIRAPITLLATGANAQPLQACGVAERAEGSAIAVRAYFDAPPRVAREWRAPAISFDAAICPGYGWVFPGPGGVFNVGAGFFYDARTSPPTRNVRVLWRRFVDRFSPARELVAASRQCGPLKGAPLRTALTGASLARPGLLVVGEAAGLTYSLSGEGIGKAMESALVAADVVGAAGTRSDPAALADAYSERIRFAFTARFRAYTRAQGWLERRWLANVLARRAARDGFVRRELEAMLKEDGKPAALFSWPRLLRALFFP